MADTADPVSMMVCYRDADMRSEVVQLWPRSILTR
jgi:hypothetical protein